MTLFEKSSIILTPTAYDNGSINSVIPSNGDGDFDYSGGTNGTRVNEQGLIEDVASGIPRIDYTDGTGALLLEPQSTNLVTYSEDFSDSSWDKESGATIQSNIANSPDGSINASYLKAPATTYATVRVTYTFSSTSSQTYVGSIFVKKDNVDFIRILSTGATASTLQAFYNVSNGTLGSSGTPSKAAIEDYGNGWYRLSLIIDAVNTSSSATFRVQLAKSDGAGIDNFDGTEKNLIWGAQLEQKSFATSYVPTEGSTVTRSAEVANNSGNADLFNDSEGVLYANISYPITSVGSGNKRIAISDTTSSNRVMFAEIGNTGFGALITSSGSNSAYITGDVNNLLYFKTAVKYKQNDFALWINGFEVGTDTNGNTPSGLSELAFDGGDGGNDFYGNTKALAVFKEALTDAELESLTSWISFTQMANDLEYTIE